MKKTILLAILFVTGFFTAVAQEWEIYDLFGGSSYGERTGSTMTVNHENEWLVFSGSANVRSAGYVIESTNLGLGGMNQIKLEISGVRDTDKFDHGKLLKMELNGNPVRTQNNRNMNRNDPNYLNARNGEYIFDIANLENILKINFVFYNCTVRSITVKMFVR